MHFFEYYPHNVEVQHPMFYICIHVQLLYIPIRQTKTKWCNLLDPRLFNYFLKKKKRPTLPLTKGVSFGHFIDDFGHPNIHILCVYYNARG